MFIYFRTIYNSKVGMGHIMRVKRLADYFKKKGCKCLIVLDKPSNPIQLEINHEIFFVKENMDKEFNPTNDAKEFLEVSKKKSGIVIIDDYRINDTWQKIVRKKHYKLVKISDFNHELNNCDILINTKPDFLEKKNINIFQKRNKNSINLLGPKYCIIDKKRKISYFKKKKFVITFYLGGSGDLGIVEKILLSFNKLFQNEFNTFYFYVVVGPLSKNVYKIDKLITKFRNIEKIENNFKLFKKINHTNLFVGTAGISIFETALYSIPTILVKISNNQNVKIKNLIQMGHFFILNKKHLFEHNKLSLLIYKFFKNYSVIKKEINNITYKVDDRGLQRIAEVILKNKLPKKYNLESKNRKKNNFRFYETPTKEISYYLKVRNKLINYKYSLTNKKIHILDHYVWWLSTKRKSYTVEKNEKILMYFFHEIFFIKKYKIIFSGWYNTSIKNNFLDILKGIKLQKKLINSIKTQNCFEIGMIHKKNHSMLLLAKTLLWKKLENTNKLYNDINKKFKINSNFVSYIL